MFACVKGSLSGTKAKARRLPLMYVPNNNEAMTMNRKN